MAGHPWRHCKRGHVLADVGRDPRGRCAACAEFRKEQHRGYGRKHSRKKNGCAEPSGETRSGPCQICGTEGFLHYDHDHATGAFRGWLCLLCNTGLGKFKERADLLRKAAEYVER